MGDGIDQRSLLAKLILYPVSDIRRLQEALIRGFGYIIFLLEPAVWEAFLADNFDGGIPEVDQRTEVFVDLLESEGFSIGVVAIIAHGLADNIAVFLLDETVVVLAVRAGTGKLNVVLLAPEFELQVDKFAAIIAVNAQHGKREGVFHLICGKFNLDMSPIAEATGLNPALAPQ